MQRQEAVDRVPSGMAGNMYGSHYALSYYDLLIRIEIGISSLYKLFVMKSNYYL